MVMIGWISIIMYSKALLSFCLNRKHSLLMPLSLEFVVMSSFLTMYLYLSLFGKEYYFLMTFLTMRVCDGVLGLSVLVFLMRSYGNDYMQSFNLLR